MDCSPSPALDDTAHDRHVRRARGCRLAVGRRIGKAAEHVPPVGYDCDEPRHHLARLQLVGGEPRPAPLVLELVEVVLAVAPVAVELRDGRRVHARVVRDERTVVPFAPLEVLHELELLLLQTSGNGRNDDAVLRRRRPLPPSSLRLGHLDLLLRRSADEKHAPASRPAVKPEGDFDRLPSKAAVAPPRTVREGLEKSPHVRGTPDLEEVDDSPGFRFAHDGVAAVPDVAAKERGPQARGKRVYERPQPLHAAPSGVLPAWKHLHAKRDPRPADEERVVVVARASRLCGVVSEFRPFLMAVDGLDGVVDVEDVLEREEDLVHLALVARQPLVQLPLRASLERPAHGGVGDDLVKAEQLLGGLVVADGLDVDVPRLPEQDRKNRSADDVALRAGVVARVFDGKVRAQPVEQPRRLQERREVDEPARRGDAGSGSPVDLETPAERRHVHRAAERLYEIRRFRRLQPERSCAIIHVVVFPFFRVSVFLQRTLYEKRRHHASFWTGIFASPRG